MIYALGFAVMDDSSYRLNFNPGKKNKIQYHK